MPATRSSLAQHCGGFRSNALSPAITGLLTARGAVGKGANSATLDLPFAGAAGLDSRVTFTRTSSATYYNAAGLLTLASAGTPRLDYNPATLAAQGLLIEEQRANLLLNSLLDGTSLSTQNVTVTAVAHTLSFYGTGTITLSGVSTAGPLVGSGAYPTRSTLTFTPTAGTLTLTVTGTVQFANLEAGAFATSFIPTTASQATRAADVATVNTLSPWFNATEGTLYVEAQDMSDAAHATSQPRAVSINNGSNSSIDISRVPTSAQGRVRIDDAGVNQFNSLNTAWPLATQAKVALAYKANDSAACLGGGTVFVDNTVTIAAMTTLTIGNITNTGASFWVGWIQRITYYPRRLSDAELQSITT